MSNICSSYVKPLVQRFGTFRDLTQSGPAIAGGDALSVFHIDPTAISGR